MGSSPSAGWEPTRLADVSDLLAGFAFKSTEFSGSPEDIRLLRGDNIGQGYLRWNGARRWPAKRATEVTRYALAHDDVVLAMDRPWIEAGLKFARVTPSDLPALLVQRVCRLRGHPRMLDQRYLAAIIGSPAFERHVQLVTTGSAVPHISGSDIAQFAFELPPLSEQRAITEVLGALDDKIESNERLVAHLTEVARLAYERAVIGAPLGALGDLGTVVGGGTPRSAVPEFWSPEEVPWITPSDMTALSGRPVIWSGDRGISQAGLAGSSARLLPSGAVVFTSRATIGLVAIARQELATNQGFISVVPCAPFSSEFVYSSLVARTEAIRAKANGSTFLEVNKTNFKAVECPLPADDRLAEHDVVASPIIALVAGLVLESRRLAAIRDALLPHLVSGRIRVPLTTDLDEAVETVLDAA